MCSKYVKIGTIWKFPLRYPEQERGPVEVYKKLGQVLSRPVGISKQGQAAFITHLVYNNSLFRHATQSLDGHLKRFWDMWSFGITDLHCTVLNKFQDKVLLLKGGMKWHWISPYPATVSWVWKNCMECSKVSAETRTVWWNMTRS